MSSKHGKNGENREILSKRVKNLEKAARYQRKFPSFSTLFTPLSPSL